MNGLRMSAGVGCNTAPRGGHSAPPTMLDKGEHEMTRKQELRAGRAYNKMLDTECGYSCQSEDPTGSRGWDMLTVESDRQANWDERGYDVILAQKAEDVLAWE